MDVHAPIEGLKALELEAMAQVWLTEKDENEGDGGLYVCIEPETQTVEQAVTEQITFVRDDEETAVDFTASMLLVGRVARRSLKVKARGIGRLTGSSRLSVRARILRKQFGKVSNQRGALQISARGQERLARGLHAGSAGTHDHCPIVVGSGIRIVLVGRDGTVEGLDL